MPRYSIEKVERTIKQLHVAAYSKMRHRNATGGILYSKAYSCVGYGDATHSFRANINNLLRYLNVRNI